MANPVGYVGFRAGKEVIETYHIVSHEHQPVDEMGAHEAGALGKVSWVRGVWGRSQSSAHTPVTRTRFLRNGSSLLTAGYSPLVTG